MTNDHDYHLSRMRSQVHHYDLIDAELEAARRDTGGTLDGWEDELNDWTDANRHDYRQAAGVSVLACECGKWPLHHVHTGDRPGCTCDDCHGDDDDARWRALSEPPCVHRTAS